MARPASGCFLALAAACFGSGCSDDAGFADPPPRATLGEAVYQIAHDNLARSTECSDARLVVLEARREAFIEAFDTTLTEALVEGLPESMAVALLPRVDDGTLLDLADLLARRLALLLDDGHGSEPLAALLSLLRLPTVASRAQLLDLADPILGRDDLPGLVHVLAAMGGTMDHDVWVTVRALEVTAALVDLAGTETGCDGLELDRLPSTLLDPNRFEETLDFGAPAWAARADSRGLPKVLRDRTTGALRGPFVDRDRDGEADLDALGRSIDAAGNPILLEPFGRDGPRDEDGRALASSGDLVFEYFDAKRTGVSVLLQFLGEALAAGWHRDLIRVLSVASSEQEPCPGEAGCWRYPAGDHPVADLAFALLEDLRYGRIATLLATWDLVVRDRPELAEQVLVSAGRLLEGLDDAGVRLTDADLIGLLAELMPLLAEVYESDNTSDRSTPRLLLDVVHQLGDVARDFPPKLQATIDYVTLHKADSCSSDPPDLAASRPVDWAAPRRQPGGGDNRSGLEQTVELLSVIDCGSVPLTGGKTVAELVVDTMASSSAETACGIIEVSLGFIDLAPNFSEAVATLALDAIGCPGDEVWPGLEALDGLAKSGVLEAYLPIANAFAERGQVRTLLDMFHVVAADLRRDEDEDPESSSAIRRLLPALGRLAGGGAIDALFDLVDVLVTVRAVDGSGSLADVVVDSFDYLLDDRRPIRTRRGEATGTSVGLELLRPYREVLARLHAAGEAAALDRVIEHVAGYLRRTQAGGASLADRRVLTNIGNLLGLLSDTFDLTPEQRDCWFTAWQGLAEELLTGPAFATAVRLAELYLGHPDGRRLDDLAIWLLDPSTEGFSPAVRLVTALLQLPPQAVDTGALLRFAADVVEPRADEDPTALLLAIDQVLAGDPNDLVLALARNAIDRGPEGRDEAPLEVFADLGSDLLRTSELRGCRSDPAGVWTAEEAQAALRVVLAFVQGPDAPLRSILALVAQTSGGAAR